MPRARSSAVVASPAAAAETVVCTLPGVSVRANDPIDLDASLDLTIGTTGNAVTIRVRRGVDTTGAVVATFGPFTAVAANRNNYSLNASDALPGDAAGQQYVVTVQVTAATAPSTVNAASIDAIWDV